MTGTAGGSVTVTPMDLRRTATRGGRLGWGRQSCRTASIRQLRHPARPKCNSSNVTPIFASAPANSRPRESRCASSRAGRLRSGSTARFVVESAGLAEWEECDGDVGRIFGRHCKVDGKDLYSCRSTRVHSPQHARASPTGSIRIL